MKTEHPLVRRRRALGALAGVVVLLLLLGAAFFRVQILASSTYKLRAESNRLRALDVPAPRGTIFDRNGRVIADNVPAYAVTLLPAPRDSMIATLNRLQEHLEIGDRGMDRLLRSLEHEPGQPLVISRNASFEEVSALEERRTFFPNVYIEMRPRRRYVSGPAVAHLMGYIGEVTQEELDSEAFPDERYDPRMIVGKTGVEREYETVLQGEAGIRYVEVDARGRIVGDFGGSTFQPAQTGEDIHLNVDLELQEWIHEIFPEDKTGAVVALDPADGGVLALYSHPAFDPNDFVGGIDPETWVELSTDTLKPLYNRAVLGIFPPASTFKPVVGAMALDMGVITPDETFPVPCTGGMWYGGQYRRCWKPEGHGFLDLAGAIANSCDVYFYQLGLKMGLDPFLEEGLKLGMNRRCGVDLPQESRGSFPDGREFWVERFGYRPLEGEILSLAIGQGPISQTPLKMAQFYLALARDGSAPAPTLNPARDDSPEGWELDLAPEHVATLREGLRRVMAPGGTAWLSSVEHWQIMGKTGTGENRLSQEGLGETDAWFAGIAGPPGEAPEIVAVAMVEQGGGGSAVAAPLVAKLVDFYLRRKHGIPVDTVQTLREQIMIGPWPAWALEREEAESRRRQDRREGR